MLEGQASAAGPPLALELSIEAGAWESERVLRTLIERVAVAVFAELRMPPSPRTEVSIVFADDDTVRRLNGQWRGKDRPTNVLSFPAMPLGPKGALPPLLGDVVLAFETVRREATEEGKPFDHHLSHLAAHGILHLLGFDHEVDAEAEAMEALERAVLGRLAIPDPYN